jgi:hypothetical protein
MITNRAYILKKFEEAVGTFSELAVDEGHLIATIGNLSLLLPVDMEPILRPLLGQKLGIIRVDSDYRHRVIKPTQNEHQSCDLENIAENIARARAARREQAATGAQ